MFKRFWADLKKYFRYSVISAKSQLKAEVANSYLNWIWWVLDPLCFMLIYTFMFGYVFGSKEQYFPIYIFIGLSMWNFFNATMAQSVKLVKNNKTIVTKVYFPKFILILIKIWINGFKMMISFGIVLVMMIVFRVPITWNVLYFIPIILILALFSFGCACILMHYGVYVEDLSNVVTIVLRFVFYLTGIFYNIEKKIPQIGTLLNRANPLAFLMTSMRNCMLYSSTPHRKLLLLWFVISLALSILGIRKIYKEENSYAKAI
ncbi:MAG: ABC transporter permease [Oscillospiraceae bacterium]|nr:ABC transporter permease [Oscillospiraceae bacterium]